MGTILKRIAAGSAAVALLAGATVYGSYYWQTGQFLQDTDDAYLQADYTTISPKVSGYIETVNVVDNQPVKAGDILAKIDDRDFRTALDQAKADVATAAAEIGNIDAQLAEQQSVIAEAEAAIAADQAAVTFAKQDSERYANLMKSAVASVQQAQQTASLLQQKSAALQRDRAGLVAAQQQIEVLKTGRDKAQTQLQHYQAIADQAELNLGYTTIVAPVDGTVGARSLRVGQYVQAGTQLMAIVPLQSVYVIGNYKETQLTDVRPGQEVEITVDTFPGAASADGPPAQGGSTAPSRNASGNGCSQAASSRGVGTSGSNCDMSHSRAGRGSPRGAR